MADFDKLLKKNQARLDKINAGTGASGESAGRKKIVRNGPTRPWQENLPQYQDGEAKSATQNGADTGNQPIDSKVTPGTKYLQSTGQSPDISQTITRDKPDETPDKIETTSGHLPDNNQIAAGQLPSKNQPITGAYPDNNRTTEPGETPTDSHDSISPTTPGQSPANNRTQTGLMDSDKERSRAGSTGGDGNRTLAGQIPDITQTTAGIENVTAFESPAKKGTIPGISPDTSRTNHRTRNEPSDRSADGRRLGPAGFYSVTGLKRKILVQVFLASKTSGDRISAPIAIANLVAALATTRDSIERTIYRLVREDRYLTVFDSKKGRGGWVMFEIAESVYTEMVRAEINGTLYSAPTYTPDISRTSPGPIAGQNTSSSSSSYVDVNSQTNTAQPELPKDWETIDFSELRDLLRFGRDQLIDIYSGDERTGVPCRLSAAEVQQSLLEFHYDVVVNKKRYGLNVIVGVLKKSKQWRADNYVSPIDRALEEQLEKEKRHQEQQERRFVELFDLEYRKWRLDLSPDEIRTLAGEHVGDSRFAENAILAHFKKAVFPAIRQEILMKAKGTQTPETTFEDALSMLREGLAGSPNPVQDEPPEA